MTETSRILLDFGDRLAQVHASEVDGVGKHFPISFGAKLAFSKFAHYVSKVPIILESVVRCNDIEREMDETCDIFVYPDKYLSSVWR